MALYNSHINVTATDSLQNRLEINEKYGSLNFHEWLLSRVGFRPEMDILDVGCGTGIHAIAALRALRGKGTVSAMDLSADSVQILKANGAGYSNLDAVVGDMKDLGAIIGNQFRIKRYDLTYSVYALWYCPDHFGVLDAMRRALKPAGRMVVCTPNFPNGLRESIKRLGHPRPDLDQITNFGSNVLEPYFRAYFDETVIHLRRNLLRITDTDDVLRFYKSTGYYDQAIAAQLESLAKREIETNAYFGLEKNIYLIEGIAP
jgi:SAM-dependent methyltransferase